MAGIPPELRGTFAGLAHPVAIAYLKSLGITCVELLPVHAFLSEPFLLESGRSNYWGYNSIGFFAPHGAYSASDDAIGEFKQMVSALHDAGIKLVLDVVFNTAPRVTARGRPSVFAAWTISATTVCIRQISVFISMTLAVATAWISVIQESYSC